LRRAHRDGAADSAEARGEALAGLFLAAYIGLAVPVLGLGLATQFLSTRIALLGLRRRPDRHADRGQPATAAPCRQPVAPGRGEGVRFVTPGRPIVTLSGQVW
jgi:hypothetical protein